MRERIRALTNAPLLEQRQSVPGDQEGSGQVRPDRALPPFERLVAGRRGITDTGVEHNSIKAAVRRVRRVHQGCCVLRVADVAGNDHGVIELRRDRLERLAASAREHDAVPVCPEPAGAGDADAAACSGDDRALHEVDATAG